MKLQNWWFSTLMNINDPIKEPLKKNILANVVIVGGGAAGLSAVYSLPGKNLKVVFRPDRDFLIPLWMEKIIGKQLEFSVKIGGPSTIRLMISLSLNNG
ncbi:hypothetical protein BH11BAC1_BH11BAC1_17550 [soil metagenome]